MWFKRIFWLLGVLLLAVCHIFTERAIFAALALAALILPWALLILLLIAAHGVDAALTLPDHAAKSEPVRAEILLKGRPLLSVMRVQVAGRAANLLTGEVHPFQTACTSGGTEIILQSPHCGKLSVDAERIVLKDPLGLFRRKRSLAAHASTLVLPNTFEPVIELQTPNAPDVNSDEYSSIRPGDDPSELFGIRDYRDGDSLRSIHWKLSEKYDRTVVKEMSQPVANAILLMLDNCPTAAFSADAADHAAEALISVSQALADLYITHQIAWFNRESGLMEVVSISSLDDLAGEQGRLLSARILPDGEGIVTRALEAEEIALSQHILLFAPVQPAHAEALPGEVTVLLPEADPDHAISCLPEHITRLMV